MEKTSYAVMANDILGAVRSAGQSLPGGLNISEVKTITVRGPRLDSNGQPIITGSYYAYWFDVTME